MEQELLVWQAVLKEKKDARNLSKLLFLSSQERLPNKKFLSQEDEKLSTLA
jgi:hypothetical protein